MSGHHGPRLRFIEASLAGLEATGAASLDLRRSSRLSAHAQSGPMGTIACPTGRDPNESMIARESVAGLHLPASIAFIQGVNWDTLDRKRLWEE